MPDYITVNYSFRGYSYPLSQDTMTGDFYSFVNGIRGASYPDRLQRTPEESETHKVVIARLTDLWDYLWYGRYLDDLGLRIAEPEMVVKVYQGKHDWRFHCGIPWMIHAWL